MHPVPRYCGGYIEIPANPTVADIQTLPRFWRVRFQRIISGRMREYKETEATATGEAVASITLQLRRWFERQPEPPTTKYWQPK